MLRDWFNRYRYANTRQFPRLPTSWPIRYKVRTAAENQRVTATKDVSAGGVGMWAQEMIPVGAIVQMEIHILPLKRSIEAQAQVVRCRPLKGGHFDLGIKFLVINPQDQADLADAVQRSLSPRRRARHAGSWWRKAV
ncbi:MAG: PilZ domain-containing protein [Candidatus Kerfeldbacteria bacterium]|nr:PilZ domain-containing protein [Candidatus Kerfeldbacteria bacterium]